MNDRIKELAEQAGFNPGEQYTVLGFDNYAEYSPCYQLKNFADVVRHDETKACAKHYLEIMRDAVEAARLEEREVCAKLCEGLSGRSYEYDMGRLHSAAAIRQRGEQP